MNLEELGSNPTRHPNSNMSNTRAKEVICVGRVIAHFSNEGNQVCVPLCDSCKYDLVVELDGKLKKVQCKHTGTLDSKGASYYVDLRTTKNVKGKWERYPAYKEGDFDILAVSTIEGDLFLIPSEEVIGKRKSVSVSRVNLWSKFLVTPIQNNA